ncbi:c-type cytochrome [Pelagibacterium limicola]|uniref:c-type cytochrome n=1 Tax=Pelagibacterium limicola TaxID=2791022 RepID=UPI0018AFDE14|nr:cytochrome c [Pelagibacterium limicola]
MGRRIFIGLAALAAAGVGIAAWLLSPQPGPGRDLALTPDAEHGQYLLRLGGCVACHTDTQNNGAFLAGGAPIESPFGTFFAPNITPHPQAGIGAWTLEEFSRALSDGVGRQGEHLYPAFPYDFYTRMSDQDIVDLYAGLMAVPAVQSSNPPHRLGFPFSVRLGVAAWKTMFFEPVRFAPDTTRSDLWNRGAYIVTGPAHCGACHTPRNAIGATDGAPLSGGIAPAITAEALEELGYDRAWLEDVLTGGVTPEFDIPGKEMAEVISEGTMHWTAEDITAVAAYLLDED